MRKILRSGMIVILLILSGCASNTTDNHVNQQNEYENISDVGTSYNAYLYSTGSLNEVISADSFGFSVSKYTDNADRRLAVDEFLPIEIKLSEEKCKNYVNWLSEKTVEYVYAELYDIENARTKLEWYNSQIAEQEHLHTEFIADIRALPTAEQIYDKISENSETYLRMYEGYSRLDSEYIHLIAEILTEMLSESYSELSNADLSRIYCMMNDVKAVGIDSTDFLVNDLKQIYNARVTDEAVIFLDLGTMENLRGDKIVERTIAHEAAHLFQRMCPDHRIIGLTQIGSSQYVDAFDDTGEVNSLHFQWLYEAAAEQMSMDLYECKTPLVYKNMVGYLNTLNLITLIRPEYDEKSIVVSQMSANPNHIYEIFGATTQEEKEELAHMLYSICYIQTEREDFTSVYEKEFGSAAEQIITIKKIMKESVVQTMTKYFYKNLAECVKDGNVTLQDVFYLINTFEAALSLHIEYDDPEREEYNDEAITFYVEAQDKFFEMIAQDSGLAFEEVNDKFGEYALIINTDSGYERNCQFTWLDQDEIDFVGTVLTTNMQSLTINMRNYKK